MVPSWPAGIFPVREGGDCVLTWRDVQAGHGLEEPTESDLYIRFKTLQRQLEFVEIQAIVSLPSVPPCHQAPWTLAPPFPSPRSMGTPCANAMQCRASCPRWHPISESSRQRRREKDGRGLGSSRGMAGCGSTPGVGFGGGSKEEEQIPAGGCSICSAGITASLHFFLAAQRG